MSKFRIVVFESSNENLDGVTVFRMKPDATDTSDMKSWEMVGTYNGLTSAFFRNSRFKPSEFRIVGNQFNPITLQNF